MSCSQKISFPAAFEASLTVPQQTIPIHKADELSWSLLCHDPATGRHAEQVATLSRMVAKQMGLSEEACRRVFLAGRLHDIGKLSVPISIIRKPARLSDVEIAIVRKHPVIGAEILRAWRLCEIASIVAAHHERWDGRGYPSGLRGEEIPIEARIVSLLDAVDAMRADRGYNQPMSITYIRAEMLACSGSQFDPQVVDSFLAVLNERGDRWMEDFLDGASIPFHLAKVVDIQAQHI